MRDFKEGEGKGRGEGKTILDQDRLTKGQIKEVIKAVRQSTSRFFEVRDWDDSETINKADWEPGWFTKKALIEFLRYAEEETIEIVPLEATTMTELREELGFAISMKSLNFIMYQGIVF